MDSATPKRVARGAEQSTPLRWAARAGYAANGCVHILIGVIALVVAFGGDGDADQSGALRVIAEAPLGFVALWLIAVTLWALGVWQLFEGILARAPSDDRAGSAKKWGKRVGAWGQCAIFIALGLVAASVALGARVDAEETAEEASRGVLQLPGGPIFLGLVGVGVAIAGIAFIVMGVRRSFRNKIDIPHHGIGRGISGLGVVGFIAKGVALGIVGTLLLAAAITTDPEAAGGLDGAVDALLGQQYGPWLVGATGVGFIAYGLFSLFRARYARLR